MVFMHREREAFRRHSTCLPSLDSQPRNTTRPIAIINVMMMIIIITKCLTCMQDAVDSGSGVRGIVLWYDVARHGQVVFSSPLQSQT